MAYRDEVMADSPTAYWRLGEASGTVAAEENGFYNGTYVNTPTLAVAGAVVGDTGVTFTRASQEMVTVPDTLALRPATSNFTIEFWYKRSAPPISTVNEVLFGKSGGGGASEVDVTSNGAAGTTFMRCGTTGILSIATTTIADGNWHHLVYSITRGGASYLYRDGVQVATATAPSYTLNATTVLCIGGRFVGGVYSYWFDGSLDEVAFYIGTALSGARADAHFDAATTGGTPGPWPLAEDFDEANGTQLSNLAGWVRHPAGIYAEGNVVVATNRVYNSTPVNTVYYHTADPPSADYVVEGDVYVHTMLGGAGVGIAGRIDGSAATYYELVYLPSELRWRLSRVVAGTTNEIGSYPQTLTAGQTYTAQLSMTGPTIRAYIAGTLRIAVTDAGGIAAAGHGGVAFRGAGPATATTGLHIAELRTDDVAEPEATITFVAAGTVASGTSPTTVTPGLPGGVAANDLLVLAIYAVDGVAPAVPTGWTAPINGGGTGGRLAVMTRTYQTGVSAPAVVCTGAGGVIAQVAAFRGCDLANPTEIGTVSSAGTAATNIGPITGLTPSAPKSAVLAIAGRGDDWTSVATLTGDSLTWAEIGEPDDATRGLGLVWNYAIQAGAPTAVTAKTFTVTGGSGVWRGWLLGLRAAATSTPATPGTAVTKTMISGAWVTKPLKVRISGSWVTKPVKVIGDETPPPPPPPDPDPDPPPDPTPTTGMRMIMWINDAHLTPEGHTAAGFTTPIASSSNLATLKNNGVDGFVIQCNRTPSCGQNAAQWTSRVNGAKAFANAHPEFKCYVGCTMANIGLDWTPLAPWFNDSAWATILTEFATLRNAINTSNLVGVAIDGEEYAGALIGWAWFNDPTTATEAQVRAKVYERSRSLALTLTADGPIEIAEYYLTIPGSYGELVQYVAGNPNRNNYQNSVASQWIDGITSDSDVTFRYYNWDYYKSAQAGTGWDAAYQMDQANWASYDWYRPGVDWAPFLWLSNGPNARAAIANGQTPTGFDRQRPDADIRLQLQKARQYMIQYDMGGEFALYEQQPLNPPPTVYTGALAPDLRAASA